MVAEAANTWVTVKRSGGTDKYGVSTAPVPLYQHVPVVLIDMLRPNANPSDTTPTAVRTVECHLPSTVGLLASDQLVDEATGTTYSVSTIQQPPSLAGFPVDTVASLQPIVGGGS